MPELPTCTSPALEAFVTIVEEYCALIEGHAALSPADLLETAHGVLARLYAAGLALPPTDIIFPDDTDNEEDNNGPERELYEDSGRGDYQEWSKLYHDLDAKLGEWSTYRAVFNPYDWSCHGDEAGSLADDFADIYGDLRAGLSQWQQGDRRAAFWEWRFHLERHWGAHVTSALRVLYALGSNGEISWPASGEKTA